MREAREIQDHPDRHNDRLHDEKEGRSEETGEHFSFARKPIIAKGG